MPDLNALIQNSLVQRVLEFMKRYPGLIALFGFCSGVPVSFWWTVRPGLRAGLRWYCWSVGCG